MLTRTSITGISLFIHLENKTSKVRSDVGIYTQRRIELLGNDFTALIGILVKY
jgi:hypothetical protein